MATTPTTPAQSSNSGGEWWKKLLGNFGGSLAQGLGSGTAQWAVNSLFMDSPGQMGRNAREYLDEAFPGMNPWEQSGIPGRAADTSVGALNTRAQVLSLIHI